MELWAFHSGLSKVTLYNISISWIQKPGSYSCCQKENYKNNLADVTGTSHSDPTHCYGDWEWRWEWAHAGRLPSTRLFLLFRSVFQSGGETLRVSYHRLTKGPGTLPLTHSQSTSSSQAYVCISSLLPLLSSSCQFKDNLLPWSSNIFAHMLSKGILKTYVPLYRL